MTKVNGLLHLNRKLLKRKLKPPFKMLLIGLSLMVEIAKVWMDHTLQEATKIIHKFDSLSTFHDWFLSNLL